MVRTFIWSLFLLGFFAIPLMIVAGDVRREPGIFWILSTAFMVVALCLAAERNIAWRVILTIAGTAFVFLNVALTVSFASQGTAFNSAFFAHLDPSTLKIAIKTDLVRMSVLGIYLLATPIIIFLAIKNMQPVFHMAFRMGIALTAAIFSLWASYPLNAYADFRESTFRTSARLNDEITRLQQSTKSSGIIQAPNSRNLVLIYAESLEETYFNEALFPDLLPQIKNLASEGLWFRDFQQYPGTGWTIGGIVSSQCGVPLLSEMGGNSVLNEVNNPFSEITCLAEYLKQAGYRNAYVGGASLSFAGKGQFLQDNGYDAVLGLDELPSATAHSWGMYDASLFDNARTIFDGLAESAEPFHLAVLTLDTHHPFGTPSPGCASYTGQRSMMLDAVHCADKLITDFIEYIRRSPVGSNTVIAIVSDHLLIQGDMIPTLEQQERTLFFLLLHPDLPSTQHEGPSSHFDIAPTLLDAAGLRGFSFAFGHSLLTHDIGRAQQLNLTETDMQTFKVENLLQAESN